MKSKNCTRRTFLQSVGTSVPTLSLALQDPHAAGDVRPAVPPAGTKGKFTPLDLTRYFNCSPADFGPRPRAKELGGDSAKDGLVRAPAGAQVLQGIPFKLGPGTVQKKAWLALSTHKTPCAARRVTIPVAGRAGFVCIAAFCDWDENETSPPPDDVGEKIGQRLADAVFVYDHGKETALPLRRRFEVNSPSILWGHLPFAALPHRQDAPTKLSNALPSASGWGALQLGVTDNAYWPSRLATLWICALPNPQPEQVVRALRFEAAGEDPILVCGVTLYHGSANPLRYERLSLYRVTLPEAAEKGRWNATVDLGIVARTYFMGDFDAAGWLAQSGKVWAERANPVTTARHLYVEVTASSGATLTLTDTKTGRRYDFDLSQAAVNHELEGRPAGARLEILDRQKVWLHGQVVDAATGRPTPVRLSFRSGDGRYIPPYGHRTEINTGFFQDYGADLKLMDTSFAYVDGTFQVELPVGDVYVEMAKGFEYEAVRKKVEIQAGQRELKLEIFRYADLRAKGWVTADTHVHFLSPSTAVLEGQAEGVNLINLLAAQWGDLFTNVGDFSQGPLTSRDGETIVWVGTENRQHILGHLCLLGGRGEPVYPMSASGPGESYLGDPLWESLADWSDACRRREGLVIAAHLPDPNGELAADIALDKIDAVELVPWGVNRRTLRYHEWYRYLNCGYRLPAVSGTDKMGAYMAVGATRTYAYLGKEEFSFDAWAGAIRRGNTFMTTGPLLLFRADGHAPGEEIALGASGGMIEVEVVARSVLPFHGVEVVWNGKVVASREEPAGTRELTLREKVAVRGPGWLAARCVSRIEPTTTTSWRLGGIPAHTSPVYVVIPGQELFSAPTVAYMLTLIEGADTWVQNLATRPDPERFERVHKTLVEARDRLHRRLHAHGLQH